MARTMVNFKLSVHLPNRTELPLVPFPTAEVCLEKAVLPQALLQHVDKCIQHEDVIKKCANAVRTHIRRVTLQLISSEK